MDLTKIKNIVEIIAIVAAGIFTFFTWGVDYLNLNQPNWTLEIREGLLESKGIEADGVNLLCPLNDTECQPTSCISLGNLVVTNGGSNPITIDSTRIDVYLLPRIGVDSALVAQSSTYEYLKATREFDKVHGLLPDYSFHLNEIDAEPVWPGREGWRPFAIEINPKEEEGIGLFGQNHVMLLVITQVIRIENRFLPNKKKESKLVFLNHSICGFRELPLTFKQEESSLLLD